MTALACMCANLWGQCLTLKAPIHPTTKFLPIPIPPSYTSNLVHIVTPPSASSAPIGGPSNYTLTSAAILGSVCLWPLRLLPPASSRGLTLTLDVGQPPPTTTATSSTMPVGERGGWGWLGWRRAGERDVVSRPDA